mgnify:CR=1 FL=1
MSGTVYKDIVTQKQCFTVAKKMVQLKNENKLNAEGHNYDAHYYYNSFGSCNLPEALDLLSTIDPIIKRDHPNLRFENCYTRIYQNGSTLRYHTDRPELYLTLSLCMFSNITTEWPLYVSNVLYYGLWRETEPFEKYAADCTAYITPPGTGVTCYGLTHPHWREKLKCADDQMVIQTFYHWNMA